MTPRAFPSFRIKLVLALGLTAVAALVVLVPASEVDFGAVAAAWNVRHAREVGGAGVELDLGYLRRLGPAALVPLAELERRPLPPEFADRERLFEPFFTSRRAEGGAGLGLSIARSLLAASHARIAHVDGAVGAVFELVLPRARG